MHHREALSWAVAQPSLSIVARTHGIYLSTRNEDSRAFQSSTPDDQGTELGQRERQGHAGGFTGYIKLVQMTLWDAQGLTLQ